MSVMNILHVMLAKLLAFLYSFLSFFGGGILFDADLPETPDSFTPVLRFAVCSDIHLSGDPDAAEAQRLEKMINFMYEYSETQEYKNFDALCVAGDFADQGKPEQYDLFNQITSENLREGTQLLTCMGNHEFINYRDYDASLGARMYEEKRGELNTAVKINGYHFILCSYAEDGKTFTSRLSWLNNAVKEAVRDTGDKPVFTFQHPAPFATVYGSISWGDPSVGTVFLKYPQVINFSGHSHYPVNDPRSIWQGGYTSFGCGTLSYFETDLDGISGNFPYNVEEAAQFYIVEADEAGNVRVMPYDLITDTFFDNEYYLTDLAKRNYDYSYLKMKLRDTKPVFPETAEISVTVDKNGDSVLTFTGAQDKFVVESYKVNVTKNGITVVEDNFSGKYMYLFEEDSYTVNLGKLEAGKKYRVSVTAMNAFTELSEPLTYSFTAQ